MHGFSEPCTMVNKKQPITFIYLSVIYLISHWHAPVHVSSSVSSHTTDRKYFSMELLSMHYPPQEPRNLWSTFTVESVNFVICTLIAGLGMRLYTNGLVVSQLAEICPDSLLQTVL